jgi:hypothetical protein
VLGLGGVVLAVGGFVAYQSGLLTVDSALNLIGLGPGDVEVDNFRDDTIRFQHRRCGPWNLHVEREIRGRVPTLKWGRAPTPPKPYPTPRGSSMPDSRRST